MNDEVLCLGYELNCYYSYHICNIVLLEHFFFHDLYLIAFGYELIWNPERPVHHHLSPIVIIDIHPNTVKIRLIFVPVLTPEYLATSLAQKALPLLCS